MNSNLLTTVHRPFKKRPLMLDGVPVPAPEAGPFLVTSSRSVLWIERAFGEGFLRVAVRKEAKAALYRTIVEEIAHEGVLREWGNVQPPTTEGILEGMKHLYYYDMSDLSLLYGEEFDIGMAPDISRIPADWLPPTWAVLVPERTYVGTLYLLGEGFLGAVVHNPSRGVVVLRGDSEPREVPSEMP